MMQHAAMQSIGRYRVDAPIGEGAMAQVYLAHDPSINRPIAIKILRAELRADPEVVRRFLAEARAAGMLSHAHIATIYDVGQSDGIPYIAMEHLDGEPLDKLLENQGRMTTERVLALAIQIADALDFAHSHGVIHRDIKPSNILICDKGRSAKLLDFGIARIDGAGDAQAERNVCRTTVGQIMGTPRYMSPEQAMGLAVDARTDLFSLGSVIYEMTTGRPAFPGNGLAALAIQISQQNPADIVQSVSDCPHGLRFLIMKLLAKKPADRFASAALLGKALTLEQAALGLDRDFTRRGIPLRIKLPLTMAATAAVALALSVGLVIDRQQATLEAMALTSASSMTNFVAQNVAVRMVDNAGLAPAEQDWMPLQAFVDTAAAQGNIRRLTIADENGTIRAANDKALVGKRYVTAASQVNETVRGSDFRLIRPVRYAGHNFGRVDMLIGREALDSAMGAARMLLIALSLFVVLVVAGVGYLSARQLSAPLRRLGHALSEVARGNTAFRLSHRRRDEIGRLFDTFNEVVERLDTEGDVRPDGGDGAADLTMIVPKGVSTGPLLTRRVA